MQGLLSSMRWAVCSHAVAQSGISQERAGKHVGDESLQPHPEPIRYKDEFYVSMVRAGLRQPFGPAR
jgi:hypothetical protein